MNIREVKKEDNPILAKLIKKVFEEHDAPKEGTVYSDPTTNNLYEFFQNEKKSILWVAEENGEIMGSCGVFPTDGLPDDCAELVKYYLLSPYRGKGVGRKLMEKSIESAKEIGYKKIYLESLPEFANAVQMYKKVGFSELDKPLGASGHTTCTVWMIKEM